MQSQCRCPGRTELQRSAQGCSVGHRVAAWSAGSSECKRRTEWNTDSKFTLLAMFWLVVHVGYTCCMILGVCVKPPIWFAKSAGLCPARNSKRSATLQPRLRTPKWRPSTRPDPTRLTFEHFFPGGTIKHVQEKLELVVKMQRQHCALCRQKCGADVATRVHKLLPVTSKAGRTYM